MLKAPTHKITDDFEKLKSMSATQVMRAVNASLDSGMANQFVSQLQSCETPDDFDQAITAINEEVRSSMSGSVPEDILKQCTTYGVSCAITRFICLTLFKDVQKFQDAVTSAKEADFTIGIKEIFRRFFEEACKQEPLKSFFRARPDYKNEAEKILPANFNVSQDSHVPKAIRSGENHTRRMAYYFATMMANSSNELFRNLLSQGDLASSLDSMQGFQAPKYAISLAQGGAPTSTCPVAHLDRETRERLLELMEQHA